MKYIRRKTYPDGRVVDKIEEGHYHYFYDVLLTKRFFERKHPPNYKVEFIKIEEEPQPNPEVKPPKPENQLPVLKQLNDTTNRFTYLGMNKNGSINVRNHLGIQRLN